MGFRCRCSAQRHTLTGRLPATFHRRAAAAADHKLTWLRGAGKEVRRGHEVHVAHKPIILRRLHVRLHRPLEQLMERTTRHGR